jgi:hypothetical protein
MGEEHFDLLSQLHRDAVLSGFSDVAGDLAGIFMLFPCDLASLCIRAALWL